MKLGFQELLSNLQAAMQKTEGADALMDEAIGQVAWEGYDDVMEACRKVWQLYEQLRMTEDAERYRGDLMS